ncbi:hypothetical protein B0H13DRAFT_2318450 [Mycena leptocephala]|nr:hypothetical protein B0H13DRAFT_2318450 [Mycena leptocephala]
MHWESSSIPGLIRASSSASLTLSPRLSSSQPRHLRPAPPPLPAGNVLPLRPPEAQAPPPQWQLTSREPTLGALQSFLGTRSCIPAPAPAKPPPASPPHILELLQPAHPPPPHRTTFLFIDLKSSLGTRSCMPAPVPATSEATTRLTASHP